GHRVPAAAVQTGVRAGLLEDDLALFAVLGQVDATAVGEVQGAFHRVGEVRRGAAGLAGRELVGEESGQFDPLGHLEDGPAPVGDEGAVGPFDGVDRGAVGVGAVPADETAVPHVQGAGVPAQVGQDVRARLALETLPEL